MRLGQFRAWMLLLVVAAWTIQPATLSSQSQRAIERARAFSQRHLDDLAARHGAGTGHQEMTVQIDERGKSHRRVQQLYRGVPVFGGEAIVHLDADGNLESVTDDYQSFVGPLDTTPRLTRDDAVAAALNAYGAGASALTAPPAADLWVLRQDRDRLVYRVRLRREDGSPQTALPVFFVDAADGRVVYRYDNLQTGTGVSLYSGTLSLNTYTDGTTYYLQDLTRKVGTFDMNNNSSQTAAATPVSDADNVFDSGRQKAAVDAQWGATQVYDYYSSKHGRNGIDGAQGPAFLKAADGVTGLMTNRVHYSTNYCNAFWDGSSMTYGDGDGVDCLPLVSVDIVGHEMTHGVIERTAALTYSGQSGGLNESFADIFGAMVERYAKGLSANTWLIGEEAIAGGVRSMANPPSDGSSVDYYSANVGNLDVHYSSGIGNKAFYLLVMGGTHHGGSMTGIGADAAEKIFFKALTTYMTSSTNYAGAKTATLDAAADLYGFGSAEYDATRTAWCLVGVGTCRTQSIAFDAPSGLTYGTLPVTLDASATSGLPVTLSVVSGPGTLADGTLTVTGAGTIVIRATQPGNADYDDAAPVEQSIVVAPATLTVTGSDATRGYWDADPAFTGSLDGLVAPDVITASFSATSVSSSPAGAYPIAIVLSDPGTRLANYEVVSRPGTLTITNPAPVLASIAPSAVLAGSGDTTVQLTGNDFVPGAVASLNGVDLVTTFDSRTTLLAVVPAARLAAASVSQITVRQGGPGGGITAGAEFRIVLPDTTGPSVTVSASPSVLWPVNGKPVAITIGGSALDPSGLASTTYSVDDEYGEVTSSGAVLVGTDGRYQFTIALPASRLGTDKDGRVYAIRLRAVDNAGNVTVVTTQVVVPHSEGK